MSAILSADDLNDFIVPGLACIKPVDAPSFNNQESSIEIDKSGNPLEVGIDGSAKELTPAQISLTDCLACSGCITSAEEILVSQHSHNELLKQIKENLVSNDKVFVASISNQSRASLATAFGLSVDQVDRCVIDLFAHKLGFKYVVGTSLGRKLSLIYESQNIIKRKFSNSTEGQEPGPVLSSICPGWVLYAEKTHPFILPKISTIKSPQQITGFLLKESASKELNIPRENIYHLSIMPCFDKKLEAARPEKSSTDIDVDCVITAKELVQLLESENIRFNENINSRILECDMNELYYQYGPKNLKYINDCWLNDEGSASGGYGLNYILSLKTFISQNMDIDENLLEIKLIAGKNNDNYEIRLLNKDTGEMYGNSSVLNGFKNIQNLIRKLKPNTSGAKKLVRRKKKIEASEEGKSVEVVDASKCDYVEIMACPGGCINGGGQIGSTEGNEKEWISKVEANYNSVPVRGKNVTDGELVNWIGEIVSELGVSEDRIMRTYFNKVEKPTDPNLILFGAKW